MAEQAKRINSLIGVTANSLQELLDVNTVVGTPITTISGVQIIPFSKIIIANLSGGGEYGDVKFIKEQEDLPFSGGSGGIVSMKPIGFIIDNGKSCQVIRVSDDPLDNLIEHASELIHNFTTKKTAKGKIDEE